MSKLKQSSEIKFNASSITAISSTNRIHPVETLGTNFYQPLHQKYRPKTFAELVGQEAIARTLTNALLHQRIAPAYLFTGSRGTGKTSSARIMAKSLNCQSSNVPTNTPCGTCEVCQSIVNSSALDVIEIDAASNTGVDNIRELIERAQFVPVVCRYKVYIVDEVHMLSMAAFNALLKTLEEPPQGVVFILATTDPQKLPATIISRCQRFDFRRIPQPALVAHLKAIASKESISITDDALHLVGQISQGGLRDAESLLDQLGLLDETIDLMQVWNLVGSVPDPSLFNLLEVLVRGDVQDSTRALELLHTILYEQGREPGAIITGLLTMLRNLQLAMTTDDDSYSTVMPDTWTKLMELAETDRCTSSRVIGLRSHIRTSDYAIRTSANPILWLECLILDVVKEPHQE
jgi:DNA polymerase III subunit gamma/tau